MANRIVALFSKLLLFFCQALYKTKQTKPKRGTDFFSKKNPPCFIPQKIERGGKLHFTVARQRVAVAVALGAVVYTQEAMSGGTLEDHPCSVQAREQCEWPSPASQNRQWCTDAHSAVPSSHLTLRPSFCTHSAKGNRVKKEREGGKKVSIPPLRIFAGTLP